MFCLFVCLFVWGSSSHSRIFHSCGDVTITCEGLQILTWVYSALMAIDQWGFLNVPHLLWHGASVYNGHLQVLVTLTPIDERLAVEQSLPYFYDLGLSRLGFEHPTFRLRGDCSNPLRHRRGFHLLHYLVYEMSHISVITCIDYCQSRIVDLYIYVISLEILRSYCVWVFFVFVFCFCCLNSFWGSCGILEVL